MPKQLYILISVFLLVVCLDIFSYQNTSEQTSISKLENYINKKFNNTSKLISKELKSELFTIDELTTAQLNRIKRIEKDFKNAHISIQIRDKRNLVIGLNNKDHNTICKTFKTQKFQSEICINPFDENLMIFKSINHEANLTHQFKLSNKTENTFFLLGRNIEKVGNYRPQNLCNLILLFYFFIFLYGAFKLITSDTKWGIPLLFVIRIGLFMFPNWHTRYDNSVLMHQVLDWQRYSTYDLFFDSIIIFLLLSTFSRSVFTKSLTKNLEQYNALHSILISLLIVGHIRLIQVLSFSNKVKLSINDLSKIELSGIAVFFSILLIQAGIFIYAVNFIKNMKSKGDKKSLYLSLVLSTTAASILIYFCNLELNIFFTFLFFLSFFLLLDLFLDVKSKSITWIIWWGIFFGLYLSALFFNYDIKREIKKRNDLLINSFTDVSAAEIDSLVKNNSLKDINTSLSELLILPDEANYDKSDIVSFLRKKHNNQNIKIDIVHNDDKSYFNELGDTLVFEKKSQHYYFDNLLNILWYSQKHQDSLQLFTGIEMAPSLLNDVPYIYKKKGNQLRHNLALTEEIFSRLDDSKDSQYFANSNAYIKHVIDAETFIVSKKSFSSILKPIALFSFLFSFIIVLVIGLGVTSHWVSFLSKTWPYNIKGIESLNSKIQIALILVILLSFILIAFITSSFLKSFIDNKNETYRTEQLETLSRNLNSRVNLANNPGEAYAIGTNYKDYIENIHNVDLSFNSLASAEFQQEYFPFAYFTKYKNPVAYSSKDKNGYVSYLPFKFERELIGFVKVTNRSKNYQELNVFDFLGSIFNVYVFLFLIASVLAVFIARSITKPLSILNQKLSQLKFGKRNELITWDGEDEIGTLINNYNNMVGQLEDSAQLLAKTERDSAWREMAKQVAHEIKNPLTPMKMYIQHLEKAIKQKPDEAEFIAKKISKTLLEQVENLTQIANSFGNFAELPKSSNEKIELNTVVEVVHNLFRKRDDMEIKLSEPIDTIYVYADKNQLIRILNNLVKNATEAIPKDVNGFIHLHLFQKENKAIIKVTDNGTGIPEEMKDKVFQPKFTTKDSGSGLGLAIALNMIESMNGRLYFESAEGGGTSFIIELDIIRSQSISQVNRISLD